ncbi:MAG: hypothetical protein FJ034_05750 [Chloroflexi bacterium]|nr:hypothetical protein [Chloroflexota bacterium]
MNLLAFAAGAFLGVLLVLRLLQAWRASAVRSGVERWRRYEAARIAAETEAASEAVLLGKVGEQLAPLWSGFPWDPGDARFLGSPIDFVVFDGASDVRAGRADRLREIVFVDVKTGGARLTPAQRRVRELVERKRVGFRSL